MANQSPANRFMAASKVLGEETVKGGGVAVAETSRDLENK
jgi:hypothetical protein